MEFIKRLQGKYATHAEPSLYVSLMNSFLIKSNMFFLHMTSIFVHLGVHQIEGTLLDSPARSDAWKNIANKY